jgi:hypothetical protein
VRDVVGDPPVLLLSGVAVPDGARVVGTGFLDVREQVGVAGCDVPGGLSAADHQVEDLPAVLVDVGGGCDDGAAGHGGEEGEELGAFAVRAVPLGLGVLQADA